ncbi:MAG TPA: hypothetical protein VFB06_33920 [Streptosporangiaceae bacterium]|nr:hypothetical protein [Streptosporangiaceae bacterium]
MTTSARDASNSSSPRPGRSTLSTGTPSGTPTFRRSAGVGILAVTLSPLPTFTVILGGTLATNVPAPRRVSTSPSSRSIRNADRAVSCEMSYSDISAFSPRTLSPRRFVMICCRSSAATWT